MAGRSRGLILRFDPDAVGFFDHVPVGNDVATRVDNHARSQGALADIGAIGSALTAEKLVEEILKAAVVVALITGVSLRIARPAPARRLNGRFGVDVDNTRLDLLGDL